MALLTMFINNPTGTSIQRDNADSTPYINPDTGMTEFTKPLPAITLDVTIEESLDVEAEITDHPIEDGSIISDHIILKPKILTLNGVISETPLGLSSALQGASVAAVSYLGKKTFGKIGNVISSVGAGYGAKAIGNLINPSATGSRMKDIVDELILARDAKSPITIQTALRLYPSASESKNGYQYLLQKVSFKRNQNTGKSIDINLTLKEIKIVKSEVVENQTNLTSASKQKDLGKKATEAIETSSNKAKSLFKNLWGGVKSFFGGS